MVYQKAQAEIMEFENTDVITTSGCGKDGGAFSCTSSGGTESDWSKDSDPNYVLIKDGGWQP